MIVRAWQLLVVLVFLLTSCGCAARRSLPPLFSTPLGVGVGDGDKPPFLTEFGVPYGSGCCNRPVDPPEKLETFMRDAVQWLQESDTVSGWAWLATTTKLYNGSLMTSGGDLNPLGETYSELGRVPR